MCMILFSGIAGCCAKTTVAPFDRVKILLQAHHKHYSNLGQYFIVLVYSPTILLIVNDPYTHTIKTLIILCENNFKKTPFISNAFGKSSLFL